MSILKNFLEHENKRIQKLFEIVEKFSSVEIDRILILIFAKYSGDYMGKGILKTLKAKISNVLNMKIASYPTDDEFIESFKLLSESNKRCLLVTIANDCCKLGVLNESQILTFLESQLTQTPSA